MLKRGPFLTGITLVLACIIIIIAIANKEPNHQLNDSNSVNNASPLDSLSPLPSPETVTQISGAASNVAGVPELGIQMTLPTGLSTSDLEYVPQLNRPGTTANPETWSTISFSTASLEVLDSECSAAEGSIGIIVRYSYDPTTINAQIVNSAKIGPYYYGLAIPQGPCTNNPNAEKLQATQIGLLEQAFQTIAGSN